MIKFKKLMTAEGPSVRVAPPSNAKQFQKDLENLRPSDILRIYVEGKEAYISRPSSNSRLQEVRASSLRAFRWAPMTLVAQDALFREQYPNSFSPALSEQLANSGVVRYKAPLEERVGKHNNISDSEFDPKELKMGTQYEKAEHTDDPEEAKGIAKDHLAPDAGDPHYYSKMMQFVKKGWLEDKD